MAARRRSKGISLYPLGDVVTPRLRPRGTSRTNENARGRSLWRLHIVTSRRSVGGRVLRLAPSANPNSLRRSASIGMASGRSPRPIEIWSFSSLTGRQRSACAVRRFIPARPAGNPPTCAGRSIFRLGLSINLRLAPPADPSAPGSAVNPGFRRRSTLRTVRLATSPLTRGGPSSG